ncbi:hypothetical protein PRNP1_013295 [Phytophthora ramorum]
MTIFVEAEHAVSDISAVELSVCSTTAAPSATPLLFCDAVVAGHKLHMLVDSGASHCIVKPGVVVPFPTDQNVTIAARGFDGKSESRTVSTGKLAVSVERCIPVTVPFFEWPMDQAYDGILGQPWLQVANPAIDWSQGVIQGMDGPRSAPTDDPDPEPAKFSCNTLEIDEFVGGLRAGEYAELYRVEMRRSHKPDDVPTFVARLLHDFRDVMPDELPSGLPPERPIEHDMQMKPDAKPSMRAPFRHSQVEKNALDEFVASLLKKQWIEKSYSPWVSNIFAVPKKDPRTGQIPRRIDWIRVPDVAKVIRWVIDYRYVNSATLVPRIPLPHIEELFGRMVGAVIFSVLDLMSGYHQMRVSRRARPYTAFRANDEIYQWLVAPMGLAGMPGTWTRLMQSLFGGKDFQSFVVVYLDDICVFSRSPEAHEEHLRRVFTVLRAEKLYVKREKCHFAQASVTFLGHVISAAGLSVDPDKTSAIASWPTPQKPKDLQRFIGLAGYYRRFIPDFATMLSPLSDLLKHDVQWIWNNEQARAFNAVKSLLLQAPILKLPDPDKAFAVSTDASKIAVGGVLSQQQDGFDHPVAYFSKKLNVSEQKWPTHEQELFAIKLCMGRWRVYLLGRQFVVYTDNSACRWFLDHPDLSPRLTRWLEFFGQFSFTLEHRSGSLNVVADALSRPPVSLLTVTFDNLFSSRLEKMLVVGNVCFSPWQRVPINAVVISTQLDDTFRQLIMDEYKRDTRCAQLVQRFEHDSGYVDSTYAYDNGLLVLKCKFRLAPVLLPRRDTVLLRVLHDHHDGAIAAHPGVTKTYLAIRQWFVWEGMRHHIEQYVLTCECCVRSKSSTRAHQGLLQPLPVPNRCWEHVTMDFVTGLPISRGFNAVLVVVDRLSKRPCYLPTTKDVTAEDSARLFFDQVVRYYSLPSSIVSDRDSKFCSKFWQALMKCMGVKLRMTVSKRAQADGQSERQVRTLEDALRCTVSHYGDDWADMIPTVEYAHATAIHSSTKLSPFELDTGRQPTALIRVNHRMSGPQAEFVQHREDLLRTAKEHLKQAQARQAKYYNKNRKDVTYEVGDLAYIDAKVINLNEVGQPAYDPTKDPTVNKLLPRWIGPYPVDARIGANAYRLKLPRALSRRHPSFNVDQLKRSMENPPLFEHRAISKAAPALYDAAGERIYVAERLEQRRVCRGKTQYLVKWLDLPDSQNSWEPISKLRKLSHWNVLVKVFTDTKQTK